MTGPSVTRHQTVEARPPLEADPASAVSSELFYHFKPLFRAMVVLTITTGVLFPLALTALARTLFPHQAAGSLMIHDGRVVGSELIAQNFSGPEYFHPRPSAAGNGYDAASSGGANLGPNNPKLGEEARALAAEYRLRNGLTSEVRLPVDAVTRSGSGLDPHISPTNADLQMARVARMRALPEDFVRRLAAEHTCGRQLGFLGEPRVAILPLNDALDRAARAR